MNTENTELMHQEKTQSLSSPALARRRMLVKGLSKGSAVLVGSVSIQSLASATTLVTADGKKCSISGQHSAVHSQSTDTQTCGGHKCSTYKDHSIWPGNVNKNADHKSVCKDSQLKAYGKEVSWSGDDSNKPRVKYSGNDWVDDDQAPKVKHIHPTNWKRDTSKKYTKTEVTCTLKDVIDFHSDNNEDEAHWVCAWLNAHKFPTQYPYTPEEIIEFYDSGKGTEKYANALAFCKTLETT